MVSLERRREVGRGERVLPGVWRLRLPMSIPGIPHCNAWAVAAGDGVVLFDCGMHEPGSLAHLERALDQVNLRLEHVRLLVCTHAHMDHYGQAATIVERTGCELWMHPDHEHMSRAASRTPTRRSPPAWRSRARAASPRRRCRRWAESRARAGLGHRRPSSSPHRPLLPGVEVRSDLGPWLVIETPGPRALARLPVPARAPPADQRRPPARPRLALLRLRLHARPGRRVPGLARARRGLRPAPLRCPATGARSPTSAPTSTPTARSWTSASSALLEVLREQGPVSAFERDPGVCTASRRRPATSPGGCRRRCATCAISRSPGGAVPRARRATAPPSAGAPPPDAVPSARTAYDVAVRIDELLSESGRPVFSFEFFPPKTEEGLRQPLHRGRRAATRCAPTTCR